MSRKKDVICVKVDEETYNLILKHSIDVIHALETFLSRLRKNE